jgi:hypothetical protein
MPTRAEPAVGPSAIDLAAAVTTILGTDPRLGTHGRHRGRAPREARGAHRPRGHKCGANQFYLWYDEDIGGRWATNLGDTVYVWIIDAPGACIWIDGETPKDANPEFGQQILQIIDSIQFEQPICASGGGPEGRSPPQS